MSIAAHSKTAADNIVVEGISVAEGMAPGDVNGWARAYVAAVKRWQEDMGGSVTTGGTANAQTITTNSALTAHSATNGLIGFKAGFTNTGAATFNPDGVGAKKLRKYTLSSVGDVDLAANDIRIGGRYLVGYDAAADTAAGAYILLNPALPVIGTDVEPAGSSGSGLAAHVANADPHTQYTLDAAAGITGGSITGITDLAVADGGTGGSSASQARVNLGLALGIDVQQYDADLVTLATAFTTAAAAVPASLALHEDTANGTQKITLTAPASIVTTDKVITFQDITGTVLVTNGLDVPIADGGTGASTAEQARANLGIGTVAEQPSNNVNITGGSITGITDLAVADGGTGASTAAGARTNLGVAIGTDVQAYDADLTTLAANITAAGHALVDDANAAAQRTTLGLGTAAEAIIGTSGATVPLNSTANTFSSIQVITTTNAGTPELPLSVKNNSGVANTEAGVDFNPSTLGTGVRSAQITARNDGVNAISLLLKTSNGAAPATRVTVFPAGGVNIGAPTGGDKGAATLNATALYQAGVATPKVLTGSKTHDFGIILSGGIESTTVTVAGAALGDAVTATLTTLTTQAMNLVAKVSAADTVTVHAHNFGAASVDLTSGTLKAYVFQA